MEFLLFSHYCVCTVHFWILIYLVLIHSFYLSKLYKFKRTSETKNCLGMHWRIQFGCQGHMAPRGAISFIFMQFLAKNRLVHLGNWHPQSGKSWIHHWKVCTTFSEHLCHWYNWWNVLCHILFPGPATKTFLPSQPWLLLRLVACWLMASSRGRSWN